MTAIELPKPGDGGAVSLDGLKRTVPSPSEQKRQMRKRKAPINFRLNKILVRAESADEVLGVVGEHLSDFNIVNIGTALYRLALVGGSLSPSSRDSIRTDERFSNLISEIVETLEGDSERDSLQHVCF
jgi:hypothetical protein